MSNEELADVWYALTAAEARHPGRFTQMLGAAFDALGRRLDVTSLAAFLDERYKDLGALEPEEAPQPAHNTGPVPAAPVRDTYPA
jgi:rubrerythrin